MEQPWLTMKQARTKLSQDSDALSVLASYDGPFEEIGFTVTVYSSASIAWDKTIPKAPFRGKVTAIRLFHG